MVSSIFITKTSKLKGPQKQKKYGKLVFIMKNMEQEKGRKLNLQFFAEPGEDAGTPPTSDSGNYEGNTGDNGDQAFTPSTNDTGGQGQTQFTPEQYQNAIKGMNQAQQEAAAYRKLGLKPEEIQEQIQLARSIQDNPQQLVESYLQQNPQVFQTLLQQRMGFQQQPADPYAVLADITDPTEYGKKLAQINEQQSKKIFEEQYGPKIKAIEQTFQQQKEASIQTNVNNQITDFAKAYPDSGITQEAVWKAIKQSNIPINMLEQVPSLVNMAIIDAAGGLQQYNEKIGNSKVQKHQQEIISNARSTAQLSPSGGINAISANAQLEGTALRDAAQTRLAQIMAAQK